MKDSGLTKIINQKHVITKNLSIIEHFINFEKSEELKSFKNFQNDLLINTRGTYSDR